jgi:hypothetical protein
MNKLTLALLGALTFTQSALADTLECGQIPGTEMQLTLATGGYADDFETKTIQERMKVTLTVAGINAWYGAEATGDNAIVEVGMGTALTYSLNLVRNHNLVIVSEVDYSGEAPKISPVGTLSCKKVAVDTSVLKKVAKGEKGSYRCADGSSYEVAKITDNFGPTENYFFVHAWDKANDDGAPFFNPSTGFKTAQEGLEEAAKICKMSKYTEAPL